MCLVKKEGTNLRRLLFIIRTYFIIRYNVKTGKYSVV